MQYNDIREAQQSIFCEGNCKQWMHMHRQCASLTVDAFNKTGESELPLFCLHCTVSMQNQDINKLKKLDKI